MPARPTIAFELFSDVGVLASVQLDVSPCDADWEAYMDTLLAARVDGQGRLLRCLVLTDGGRPSMRQIERLRVVAAGWTPSRVALVTASPGVHFVISVLTFINPLVRSFRPTALRDALSYLEIPAERQAELEAGCERLRKQLLDASVAA